MLDAQQFGVLLTPVSFAQLMIELLLEGSATRDFVTGCANGTIAVMAEGAGFAPLAFVDQGLAVLATEEVGLFDHPAGTAIVGPEITLAVGDGFHALIIAPNEDISAAT